MARRTSGAAAALRVRRALLDGELAPVLPDGRTSFQELQNALHRPPPRGLAYFAFDLRRGGAAPSTWAAAVPHLSGRPLTLVHAPGGLAGPIAFMEHSRVWAPPAVRRVEIQEKTKRGEYLVVDDARALLSLVQMDVLELHTWNSRTGRLEHPDRVVLDLDPGPEVPWGEQECLAFARGLAVTLERHAPARYTTAFARRGRERRILLDYLRNNRTNTSVAASSTRARPGLPVSVPLAWDELAPGRPLTGPPGRWRPGAPPLRERGRGAPGRRGSGARMLLPESHVELARWGAASIRESFAAYQAEFMHVTRRARARFEARDWSGAQADALERLELRGRRIASAVGELRGVLGRAAGSPLLREQMKLEFERDLADRPDPELAKTFFNSVTRRLFGTIGVNPRAEFLATDPEPRPGVGGAPIFATYPRQGTTEELVTSLLRDRPFAAPWRDLEGDARLVAAELEAHVRASGGGPIDAVEVLRPVFYRGKGAYLVGRIRCGRATSPLILPLLHEEGGVHVDAVLAAPNDASIVFSFTRSYFHVDAERPAALIAFLRSILPRKPVSELYVAVGHHKHGKTVLYREIVEHLARTSDRFEAARGDRGMVMAVFTLPSLDVVFKVIRDRFAPPKSGTRQEVMDKYALVFRHDRAGRLVDAQEFEHLVFARSRFAPEVVEELLREAGQAVRADADRVFIRHLYAERRVTPLNLFVRERDATSARDALLDYGQCIRDLAATNIFPGDLLLKNFGVTRHGRVIFYDYDELCLVTDCNFRDVPAARDDDEETSGEPWFYVGERDVFPEEFMRFLGMPEPLRGAFLAAHGEIMTAEFWRGMQARHSAGEIVDIFPYREAQRLPHRR